MFENLDLILIPTRNCNPHCRYCPVEKNSQSLKPAVAVDAVRRFIRSGGQSIRLTGGEPLLEWKLVENILDEIDKLRSDHSPVRLEICTNGILLDREKLSLLGRPWITTVLSFDGDMETQIKSRLGSTRSGKENFFHLVDIAGEITKSSNYFVTQTISPSAKSGPFDNFLFLWNLGIRNFNFLPVYYKRWSSNALLIFKRQLNDIAMFILPYLAGGEARVRNIEKKGIIPLFGHSLCLDVDGRYYYTNGVLLRKLRSVSEKLKVADRFQDIAGNMDVFLEGNRAQDVIGSRFSPDIMRSNRKVDFILTGFVNTLKRPRRFTVKEKTQRPERLELHLSYKCTNNCIFCSERHRLSKFHRFNVTASEAWHALLSHKEAGGRHVNFTGGEPTVHPNFLPLLEGAKNLGFKVYIGTNGVMLGREEFARTADPLIDELSISIHGPDENIHAASTGNKESFSNILESARLAVKINPGIMLMANMVVTKINFDHTVSTLLRCADLGVQQMLISYPSPEGRALDNYKKIAVPLEKWKEAIGPIAEAADRSGISVRFFGLPVCILGQWKMKSNDLFFDPRVTVERGYKKGGRLGMNTIITRHPKRGRRKVKACGRCSFKDLCGGIFTEYVKLFKDKEIAPI